MPEHLKPEVGRIGAGARTECRLLGATCPRSVMKEVDADGGRLAHHRVAVAGLLAAPRGGPAGAAAEVDACMVHAPQAGGLASE